MSVLGSVGQLYMFVLLILLFLGSGFALWSFINFIMSRNGQKNRALDKKVITNKEVSGSNIPSEGITEQMSEGMKFINQTIGGLVMNNGWLKLAVFSFVGILVSVIILGFVSVGNPTGANIHLQHQQQGMQQGTGNMNIQGGMNGNMSMQANGGMMQDNNMMMQQLNQMPMMLNQMQQQMGMMNGNMGGAQMQQGGMGMMNMGGMSGSGSMQQNNGGMSMPQNNGGNSGSGNSGSMSGMGMM